MQTFNCYSKYIIQVIRGSKTGLSGYLPNLRQSGRHLSKRGYCCGYGYNKNQYGAEYYHAQAKGISDQSHQHLFRCRGSVGRCISKWQLQLNNLPYRDQSCPIGISPCTSRCRAWSIWGRVNGCFSSRYGSGQIPEHR